MKKVLIVSYYWPPAGGPGAQRMVKFARYLGQYGWQPVILTVNHGEFPYRDTSLGDDLPEEVKIYRSRNWDPFSLYKKITGKESTESIPVGVLTHHQQGFLEKIAAAIRTNIFVPDARIGWVPFAVSAAGKIIRREKIDLIFVSSPPHSAQLIGLKLKKKTGLPFVCDLRDPWTDIRYYEFARRFRPVERWDRRQEQQLLESCDAVTTVSRDLVRLFSLKSNAPIQEKCTVLPNGFDTSDFRNLTYHPGKSFQILHTGNLQDHQNPLALWQALEQLPIAIRKRVKVQFIGHTHPDIEKNIENTSFKDQVQFLPFIPHRDVLPHLKNADLLLVVIPRVKNNRGIVTGKLFEYLGADRPVLIIGPRNADAAKIIRPFNNCKIFDYEDTAGILSFLKEAIEKWNTGEWTCGNRELAVQYSREALSKRLAELFDRLVQKEQTGQPPH